MSTIRVVREQQNAYILPAAANKEPILRPIHARRLITVDHMIQIPHAIKFATIKRPLIGSRNEIDQSAALRSIIRNVIKLTGRRRQRKSRRLRSQIEQIGQMTKPDVPQNFYDFRRRERQENLRHFGRSLVEAR